MRKLNIEKLLLIFIALCPILDATSFLFRENFGLTFSPSTFARPIIPIMGITYIFFKYKFKLKLLIAGLIYGIYGIIHLLLFKSVITGISYGTISHEMQYIVNYTYMILNLFIYVFIFRKENYQKLKKYIVISIIIYILIIYISIITNTSSRTYIEGMGYKGFFESGNSISSILILSLFILLPMIKENKKLIILIALIGIFLMFLVGTRVGLYGFILTIIAYTFTQILFSIKQKIKINKKAILLCLTTLIGIVIIVVIFGSSTMQRRKYLESIEGNIIDNETKESSHVTGDILKLKEQIELGKIEESYISKPAQESILELYKISNEMNLANTDRRMQQFIYNYCLVKNQNNILLMLFGNGFLANYGELTLEMELPAILFNFGIIGFILYIVPFLGILMYCTYIGIKKFRKIDVEYMMLICGSYLVFALSFFAGYTFFNSSTMMLIIIINVLLINETKKVREIE